tara:strand:+ start:2487 stop:2747 length:261 start_codon:yes stop_codon:yes gene_type:complete
MQNFEKEMTDEIIQVGLQGEYARGDNGAVLVDQDSKEIVYLLSHEFKPNNFSLKLQELLSEDYRKHVFVVVKTNDALHISKIPRGV